jgi:hypothetical protein
MPHFTLKAERLLKSHGFFVKLRQLRRLTDAVRGDMTQARIRSDLDSCP